MDSRDVKAVAAVAASTEQPSSSLLLQGEEEDRLPSPGPTTRIPELSHFSASEPPSPTAAAPPEGSSKSRPTLLPISFSPIFFQRSNAPSASVARSTAEGKPVPLADSTAAHRTSALQKLNSTYPSVVRRHQYAESTGAQSSTYSQPVLVRTYSGPSPSQGARSARQSSRTRHASKRVPLPSSSTPGSSGFASQPIQPTLSDIGVGTTSSINHHRTESNGADGRGVSMPRPHKDKKGSSSSTSSKLPLPLPLPLPWPWHSVPSRQEQEEAKLPPLEAFSFKSFMADMQAREGDNGIGADLDRIAEICARSRYSLSNQYEVHVAPHGSGASFVSGAGSSYPSTPHRKKGHSRNNSQGVTGPTLQAITSVDENSTRSHHRRRNGARRRSVAYGTLETIMSSSRSSDEDKSKKKSAAELAGEIRGRAARKAGYHATGSGSGSASASASAGNGGSTDADSQQQASTAATNSSSLARKKSASFATAIMDSGRSTSPSSHQSPASALLSEPAMPQTSNNHLGVRTATGPHTDAGSSIPRSSPPALIEPQRPRCESRSAMDHAPDNQGGALGAASSWSTWIPWRMAGQSSQAHAGAEGSLRQLLRHHH
ncbi:Stress response RCI peptide [Madurella fahalii]|uniref:Stress response RCI peptide n=1 Tax=Madurella fahalii TaxID=1157608 RepID=A0ABQ0G9C3_9PEZI